MAQKEAMQGRVEGIAERTAAAFMDAKAGLKEKLHKDATEDRARAQEHRQEAIRLQSEHAQKTKTHVLNAVNEPSSTSTSTSKIHKHRSRREKKGKILEGEVPRKRFTLHRRATNPKSVVTMDPRHLEASGVTGPTATSTLPITGENAAARIVEAKTLEEARISPMIAPQPGYGVSRQQEVHTAGTVLTPSVGSALPVVSPIKPIDSRLPVTTEPVVRPVETFVKPTETWNRPIAPATTWTAPSEVHTAGTVVNGGAVDQKLHHNTLIQKRVEPTEFGQNGRTGIADPSQILNKQAQGETSRTLLTRDYQQKISK